MKKVYLVFAFLTATLTTQLNAQIVVLDESGNVVTGDTLETTGLISEDPVAVHASIVNASGSTKSLMCTRAYIQQPAGMTCSFCWDLCYPSHVDTSSGAIVLAGGDTTNLFISDAHPNFNNGIMLVRYTFYEEGNPSNNAVLYVRYLIGQVGVEEQVAQYTFSGAYPNPAKDFVNFNYEIPGGIHAELEIYDLSGKKVKNIALLNEDSHIKADVSSLISGVYFYTLYLNGKAVLTKRLVVSK